MTFVTIRQEVAADRQAVYGIHLEAFGRPAEADLVEALRRSPEFVPELSLVAERQGVIVGHVLLSRILIGAASERAVGLAPIAVQPALQRQGIGSRLVWGGMDAAGRLGFDAVVLIGHSAYYPRFGFVPGSRFGLRTSYNVPDDVFLARPLRPGGLDDLAGEVRYSPAFDGV